MQSSRAQGTNSQTAPKRSVKHSKRGACVRAHHQGAKEAVAGKGKGRLGTAALDAFVAGAIGTSQLH
jgi:hypothetical protein